MRISCIIIDDEPLAVKVIKNHLQELRQIVVIGTFTNPIEALSVLEVEKVDVMFLDINMSRMNGLEFLRSISVKPYVIVTTAYREYAAESYDLNVLDYLVKPIPFPRFLKAINKVTQQLYLTKNIVQNVGDQDSFIFLKVEKKLVKVKYVNMLYIQSLKDYIKVYTEEGNYIVHKSLTNILEELPSQKFLRIHRSYIISLEKVKSIEGNSVEIGAVRIPIGRKYISQAKQIILQTEMD
ncbi:LytR/AlgR family response regulator transcription factor [Tenacibaculum maritimum]|uniref:LytR/AlgR family response regulator transcription factor n=1 Tax=Tenacibaculum maritimum TaxID=107401 RepID=UPI001E483DB5|nr:response regulator transcription factor [Tenacibaculum maritimum]MCD9586140.1 response regulator transcription factor [Tenacibaculum maritimum]MCD9611819.1 response regulator transcription factor [Tenacibaculum maritimum]MCD9622090.1 response regulator transcription factor [Tenacibaculum maritimum]MCD9628510.1 response regulator transcription factor [Tenacibaculum maritimum]MCD9631345.1 response regulator transcription factor [Tenacibaculum maritimum]